MGGHRKGTQGASLRRDSGLDSLAPAFVWVLQVMSVGMMCQCQCTLWLVATQGRIARDVGGGAQLGGNLVGDEKQPPRPRSDEPNSALSRAVGGVERDRRARRRDDRADARDDRAEAREASGEVGGAPEDRKASQGDRKAAESDRHQADVDRIHAARDHDA